MYSDRYVVLHCCQEKYLKEIKYNGIVRDTKAVFICDLERVEYNEFYNTLAVLIYHGIGINGWLKLLEKKKKLNEIDKNLVIIISKISKEQEDIIKNYEKLNYYKILNKKERTMYYCKIKLIGKIKKIITIKRLSLHNIRIKNISNIDPIKDRFFIKNSYNNLTLKENKTIKEIEGICYEIAKENMELIKRDIIKLRD